MLEEMEKNQKYRPDYGYIAPKKTRQECSNPAFMDHKLHRVGYFKIPQYYNDGLPGYVAVAKCVNCGRVFDNDTIFHAEQKSFTEMVEAYNKLSGLQTEVNCVAERNDLQ